MFGAGNYTCELEWSGRPVSVTHSLTVLQPPAISQPLAGSHFQRDQGGQLRLTCRAAGDPRPQVWWSQVNQNTLGLERIQEVRDDREDLGPSTLHLSPLTRSMSGEYVCQARNSVGTAEVNIILSVNCEYSSSSSHLSLHY